MQSNNVNPENNNPENEKISDIELLEFEQLRAEINDNRKFVFERPLVIILTGVIAILTAPKDAQYLVSSFPILTCVLWLDLEICINRFKSNSRIIAFLDLKYSNSKTKIPMWETALSKYRDYSSKYSKSNKEGKKTYRFYWILALFHVLPSLLFTYISFQIVMSKIEINEIICFTVCCITLLLQTLKGLYFGIKRVRKLIIMEKEKWCEVLCNNKKCISK